jgi:hypothetical protein
MLQGPTRYDLHDVYRRLHGQASHRGSCTAMRAVQRGGFEWIADGRLGSTRMERRAYTKDERPPILNPQIFHLPGQR